MGVSCDNFPPRGVNTQKSVDGLRLLEGIKQNGRTVATATRLVCRTSRAKRANAGSRKGDCEWVKALFRGGSGAIAPMLAVWVRHQLIIELLATLEGALSGMTALMQTVIERSCTRL